MDQSLKGDNNDELSSPSKKNGSSHCAPKSKLLKKYEPIPYELIEEEMKVLAQVQELMDQLWEEECQKYEETMQVVVDGQNLTVPRRNYFNEDATVKDETLFPYHAQYYSLLDAYDCLYETGQDQPISKNAVRPNSEPFEARAILSHDFEIDNFQGYMPVSMEAMKQSLFSLALEGFFEGPADFWYTAAKHINEQGEQQYSDFKQKHSSPQYYCQEGRAAILIKLLRHSLSELQRDYRLAAAVLAEISRDCYCDDINIFRQLLAVILSSYVMCDEPCDLDANSLDHNCFQRRGFLKQVMRPFFTYCITGLRQEHAVCLAGFVRFTYLREFGSLFEDIAAEGTEEKRRIFLKKKIALRAAEEDDDIECGDDAKRVPTWLLESVINALDWSRAIYSTRLRRFSSLSRTGIFEEKLLDFFYNCVRALANIAASTVQILPDSDRFYDIASFLVRSLANSVHQGDLNFNTLNIGRNGFARPLRYADCVQSTWIQGQRPDKLKDGNKRRLQAENVFDSLFGTSPEDVRLAVRGLFLKNIVSIRETELGFGDFLLWCRYEVTPLDPLLFW